MFFDAWEDMVRVLVMGVTAYGVLVLFLRVSGNRTLAKMNAFDLVVTIALGSTLATILLSRDVSLAEGVLALAILISLQYIVALSAVHSITARRIINASPRFLLVGGRIDEVALRKARITQDEICAAVRDAGMGDLQDVAAVILETDGSLSVIDRSRIGSGSALQGVTGKAPQL